jgi:lipid-binding SYLF domain-containing protein
MPKLTSPTAIAPAIRRFLKVAFRLAAILRRIAGRIGSITVGVTVEVAALKLGKCTACDDEADGAWVSSNKVW